MAKIDNFFILCLIIFSFLREFLANTTLSYIQVFFELLSLISLFYLLFQIKFKKYEIAIIVLLFTSLIFSFFLLDSKSFFLSLKNILSSLFPLLVIPKLKFDKKFAKQILNIIFVINISFTLLQIEFYFLSDNPLNVEGGSGGIFQNFHYNGFLIATLGVAIIRNINLKQLAIGLAVFVTNSKTTLIAYILSILFFYRNYFNLKIVKINRSWLKIAGYILLIFAIIFVLLNTQKIEKLLFLYGYLFRDNSPYLIFDQLVDLELIKNSFSIFPGDVDEFYKYIVYPDFVFFPIRNEISLFYFFKLFGILNFLSFCILLFRKSRRLLFFFFITSIHYSYISSPLVYLVYFTYSNEEEELKLNKRI